MLQIALSPTPFEPWQYLADWQVAHKHNDARSGANAVFVGNMRDFNEGDSVKGMFLEHYPGMTERQLQQIAQAAMEKWQLDDALIVHRVGEILPSQPIVLVAVWSAHRACAFEACRHILEILKHNVPFWKRETLLDDSSRWVAQNTPA